MQNPANTETTWTPETMVPRMRTILDRRWPEANELFDKMLAKGEEDPAYGKRLNGYLSNDGSTLLLRTLCGPFGDYMAPGPAGIHFRNMVNAIDTAHHKVAIGQELSIEQEICKERLGIMRHHLRRTDSKASKLLKKMVKKAGEDLKYDLALERYILSGGGFMRQLTKLTTEFGDAGGQRPEDKRFREALKAIDGTLQLVWRGRLTLPEEQQDVRQQEPGHSPTP